MPGDGLIRLALFLGAAGLLAVAERFWAMRAHAPIGRTAFNLGSGAFNALILALLAPVTAISAAAFAHERGWGLLPALDLDGWQAVLLAVIAMDCAVYWQHRAMHGWGPLWRLHLMHHADPAIDVTSGVRFHPLEAVTSAAWQALMAMALGASPAAVLIFALTLNLGSLFEHANLRLPGWLDAALRWVIVTPAMHIVHHSRGEDDANRNFGFALSIWDRLFGSYRAKALGDPSRPGLAAFDGAEAQSPVNLLLSPFQGLDQRGA